MIDLHCHILPGIDDGARDMGVALQMAQTALEDGIRAIVCTPHITPGIYDNDAVGIRKAIGNFAEHLRKAGIELSIHAGADIRISPDMGERIRTGAWPSIAGTRYFLFEPDHNVAMPGMLDLAKRLLRDGLVPVLTHPERLRWIESHYERIYGMRKMGCVIQITAGAITGRFGKRAQRWAERMLVDGLVDVIATDAHNMHRRPPLLREGFEAAAALVGRESAWAMVHDTPLKILEDRPLGRVRNGGAQERNGARIPGKHETSLLRSLKRMLSLH